MKHDPFDAAQAECIQTSFPDSVSILLNYVVIFEFVYVLYNSVCFTFSSKLTNHSISEYLFFEEESFAWCLASHKKLKNLSSSTGCRVIPYNLSGVFFFQMVLPVLFTKNNKQEILGLLVFLLSTFALQNNLLCNSRINNTKIPLFFFPKCSDSSRRFFPLSLQWHANFLQCK